MRLPSRPSWVSPVVVAVLFAVLIVLAALQYRWSGQVSAAERERMQANLNTAVSQFRREFNLELRKVCIAFQIDHEDLPGRDWSRYAERIGNRLQTASDARLVANVFIWDRAAGPSSDLLQLVSTVRRFEPVPWPARLDFVRHGHYAAYPPPPAPEFRPDAWVMIERIPLLLHGLRYFRTPMESPGTGRDFIGYLMIELNLEALQQELFPELAQRVFGGTQGGIYQIAVIDKTRSDGILYQSGDGLPPDFFSSPDARTGLPLGPRDQPERTARDGFAAETRPQPDTDALQQPPLRSPQYPFPSGPGRPRNSMIVMPDPAGNSWQLLVRHHGGTLAQVVEKQRRRNLAVSFGILLVLATSMAMIVVSTQRAQRLAKLQMEFVAGVSHELRTPLSVICSAGDNLAEGVVPAANEQVRQYGELVRQEGRRLAGMVERILLFAKTQDGRQKYELRPAQVDELLESTLAKLQPAIDSAGFTLERQVESGLPPVSVHNAVFSQCLENLVNNSLKYGGEKRWLRVCAGSISTRRGCEVRITVEDRGIGIEPSDLPYIFEPFYRGKAGISAQIHGSGLGLSLAQQGIEAMGGRISVRSTPGEGSSFTIHLPAVLSTEASHSPQAEVS